MLSNTSGGPPGSGMHNGVLQRNRQERTCYGRELWDCLNILEKNTKGRMKQMNNMKDYFSSIRKNLENFSASITHATQIYKRKQGLAAADTDKNDIPAADMDDEIINTTGTSIESFIRSMKEMANDVRTKADLLFRELIEPTDLYIKHYSATNSILIEQATEIWQGLHKSRTDMLISKENYFSVMN